jgi:pilus assembly protein Flp/PilA
MRVPLRWFLAFRKCCCDKSEKVQLMGKYLANFRRDNSGVTSIEYALIAALIALVIISAVQVVGTKLSTTFTSISGNLK